MAHETAILYQGDLLPKLDIELFDHQGSVLNLTAADQVLFYMGEDDAALLINGVACTIVDAAKGLCEFEWRPGDTDQAGDFHGEVVVFFGGKPISAGQFEVKILDSLRVTG